MNRAAWVWAAAWCATSISLAATSTAWETSSYAEFVKGRMHNVSLGADGVLRPGPAVARQVTLEQPVLWNIAQAPDGSLYAGTGHRGVVYRVDPNAHVAIAWTAPQAEVFAVAVDAHGALYAGTSPNGSVFRVSGGQAVEVLHPGAKYIWAMQFADDGSLFVATGEPGRIYRVDNRGTSELYYDTGQSNVTSLTLAGRGRIYAGTDPNGLLFEITGPRRGSIVLDSTLPEIRAVRLSPDGTIYAAAVGGSVVSRGTTAPQQATTSSTAVVSASPTVITVSEANHSNLAADEQQVPPEAKPKPEQAKPVVSSTVTPVTGNVNTLPAPAEVTGVEKSAIYRIGRDRTVETLRSSKEDNVYDLSLRGQDLLFSTDARGRVYRLGPDHKTTLVAELGDGEAIRLLDGAAGLHVGLSSPAKLLLLTNGEAAPTGNSKPTYESPVHDTNTVARWGRLAWRAKGHGITFRVRTGNSARPDATWSEWSPPISDLAHALIPSANARYVQWRADWEPSSDAELDGVTVPYLPQNAPPVVHSITAGSVTSTNLTKSPSVSNAAADSVSVTVTDSGEPPAASSSSSTPSALSRQTTTQAQISWQADDPDGDKLSYSLYFRGEDEHEWKLIRSSFFENTLLLDPDVFADGRYYFRVVASDRPSNAAQYAKSAELISPAFLVDNTPPVVLPGRMARNGTEADLEIRARDATSALRRFEYSLDAGPWQPVEADDGVTDSPEEAFHVHLERLRPGEHLVVFRAYDAANNAGLAKVVLR